ncbi:hypothetical protein LZ31DRAFT_510536 [Colletotrichum somersetense]|nr:hypothetical protein LZ31DRAFT_510536 [Colletotrichum somersetense]
MKLSLLIAAVYAVASVQATCYCYDWKVRNKRPYDTILIRRDEATRYACQRWGYDPVSGNGGLVCNEARSLSPANWKAACNEHGARGSTC